MADPPYTPQFGNLVAPFPSSDFLYDSETHVKRHHLELPRGRDASSESDADARVRVRRRTRSADRLRVHRGPGDADAQQHRYDRAVRERRRARRRLSAGVRFENNGSFGFYVAPRASVSWLVASGSDRSAATRLRSECGPRHQGADVPPVVQPVASSTLAIPISSRNDREGSTPASSSGSRATGCASRRRTSPITSTT